MSIPIISFGDCDSCGRSAHNIIQAWHIRYGYKDFSLSQTGTQNNKRYLTSQTQTVTYNTINIGGQRTRRYFLETTFTTIDRWTGQESATTTTSTQIFAGWIAESEWNISDGSYFVEQTLTGTTNRFVIEYYVGPGSASDPASWATVSTDMFDGVLNEYTDEQLLADLDTLLAGPWYDPLTGITVSNWEDPLYFDTAWNHYFYYFAVYDPVNRRNLLLDLRNRRCERIEYGEPNTVYDLPTFIQEIGLTERVVQIIKPLDSVWEEYDKRCLVIGYELDRKPSVYFGDIAYDTGLDAYSQAVGWFPSYNVQLNTAMAYNTFTYPDYLVATKTRAIVTLPWTATTKVTNSDKDSEGNSFTRPLPFRHERSNNFGKFNNQDQSLMTDAGDLVVLECGDTFIITSPSYDGSKQRYYCIDYSS